MKYLLLTVCCLAMTLISTAQRSNVMRYSKAPFKIMIISDPHLLAPSLYDDGKAAQLLDAADMKLVLQSDAIMQAMVDSIIREKPLLLLITGDLTFNGEKESHERMVTYLQQLQQAGVRTLVIPGNHDVMCPYSKSYKGNEPTAVPNVTADEFAAIYHDFGYDDKSQCDPNSLSYTCEPVPGLILLGIDSNRYATSHNEATEYHTDGAVKPETLEWIKQQLDDARNNRKTVIAMMHHHLVEHIDGEALLLPNYIVAHNLEVAQVLKEGGVKAVFTGHLHITDAATCDGITDIATGSASTYPLPVRSAVIDPAFAAMTISTSFFEGVDKNILDLGRAKIEGSAPALASLISRRLWPRLSKRLMQFKSLLDEQEIDTSRFPRNANDVTSLISKHLQEPLTQSLMTVTRGGEDPAQAPAILEAVKQGVRGMMTDVLSKDADDVSDFLLMNFMPRVETVMRSALEDINKVDTDEQSSTHDHALVIGLR